MNLIATKYHQFLLMLLSYLKISNVAIRFVSIKTGLSLLQHESVHKTNSANKKINTPLVLLLAKDIVLLYRKIIGPQRGTEPWSLAPYSLMSN